jgi:hypothetical protein
MGGVMIEGERGADWKKKAAAEGAAALKPALVEVLMGVLMGVLVDGLVEVVVGPPVSLI